MQKHAVCKVEISLWRSATAKELLYLPPDKTTSSLPGFFRPAAFGCEQSEARDGMGWSLGVQRTTGVVLSISVFSSTPTVMAFLHKKACLSQAWSQTCVESLVYWRCIVSGSREALMRRGIRNVVGVYSLSVFIFLGDLVKFPCTRSVSCCPAAFI